MELMLYGKVQRIRLRSVIAVARILKGVPGTSGMVRDVPARSNLVAFAPDSGLKQSFVVLISACPSRNPGQRGMACF
ncbi:MAG: hypothetical protein NOF05_18965 [Candidatus Accumulibacter phosphatis]|uniref:hypothetical protein n=1 Tax=Candidatus Accumulibacter TaxID=327159 RepID=UPI00235B6A72|nr:MULTISPECIES: hypothetical protein [Candidatus Accumulibacter]MCM8620809.1 hypothetical protein [Accumulibacter sp.]MCQ1550835.1 hypothetical protein [Candidatus Accumulibacter phosphatis]